MRGCFVCVNALNVERPFVAQVLHKTEQFKLQVNTIDVNFRDTFNIKEFTQKKGMLEEKQVGRI